MNKCRTKNLVFIAGMTVSIAIGASGCDSPEAESADEAIEVGSALSSAGVSNASHPAARVYSWNTYIESVQNAFSMMSGATDGAPGSFSYPTDLPYGRLSVPSSIPFDIAGSINVVGPVRTLFSFEVANVGGGICTYNRQGSSMDLEACRVNGIPISLGAIANARPQKVEHSLKIKPGANWKSNSTDFVYSQFSISLSTDPVACVVSAAAVGAATGAVSGVQRCIVTAGGALACTAGSAIIGAAAGALLGDLVCGATLVPARTPVTVGPFLAGTAPEWRALADEGLPLSEAAIEQLVAGPCQPNEYLQLRGSKDSVCEEAQRAGGCSDASHKLTRNSNPNSVRAKVRQAAEKVALWNACADVRRQRDQCYPAPVTPQQKQVKDVHDGLINGAAQAAKKCLDYQDGAADWLAKNSN